MESKGMRGVPPSKQKQLMFLIEKEEQLRLKWFKRNEARLEEIANEVPIRKVPEEVMEEMKERMSNYFKGREEKTVKVVEVPPPIVEEGALHGIMRPVEKQVRSLLYANTINEGRKAYLEERYKLLPEQRYYFPETTNFKYGWNIWDITKNVKGSEFARQQVIRNSFYRRRGVNRDPEWYKEPQRPSPMICGKI